MAALQTDQLLEHDQQYVSGTSVHSDLLKVGLDEISYPGPMGSIG